MQQQVEQDLSAQAMQRIQYVKKEERTIQRAQLLNIESPANMRYARARQHVLEECRQHTQEIPSQLQHAETIYHQQLTQEVALHDQDRQNAQQRAVNAENDARELVVRARALYHRNLEEQSQNWQRHSRLKTENAENAIGRLQVENREQEEEFSTASRQLQEDIEEVLAETTRWSEQQDELGEELRDELMQWQTWYWQNCEEETLEEEERQAQEEQRHGAQRQNCRKPTITPAEVLPVTPAVAQGIIPAELLPPVDLPNFGGIAAQQPMITRRVPTDSSIQELSRIYLFLLVFFPVMVRLQLLHPQFMRQLQLDWRASTDSTHSSDASSPSQTYLSNWNASAAASHHRTPWGFLRENASTIAPSAVSVGGVSQATTIPVVQPDALTATAAPAMASNQQIPAAQPATPMQDDRMT